MNSSCTVWMGRVDSDGYGRVAIPGRSSALAHRVAYEAEHGVIPDDLTVDHLCFNKLCVNVGHLRLLTRLENQRNQRSAQKSQCNNGHDYTPENTYIRPRRVGGGTRDCRACIRDRVARYKAKRSAA